MGVRVESKFFGFFSAAVLWTWAGGLGGFANGVVRSPADITNRLNRLIDDIRSRWHAPVIGTRENVPKDVLIVAHGHILRAFAMLWVGKAIEDGPSLLLEAGGVGTLR